ncbi:Transcription initiation factor TFIID subunit 12 [Lignoscripta atroalba]|nr:Transcription initiation factor TFIID subunit 12 [Lignoscripta atroalba]
MNTTDSSAQQVSLPALPTLIRPDQVQAIPSIPPNQKEHYIQGITRIWERIHANPPDSQEHYEAHKKLAEVSRTIKGQINRWRQENPTQGSQAASQNATRPMNHSQQAQSVGYGGQGHPTAPQAQPNEQYSEKILHTVRNMSLVVPPPLWVQPPENGQAWIRDAKRKYAQYMQRFEISSLKLQDMTNQATQRQQAGKPLSSEEVQVYNLRKSQYTQQMHDAREHLNNFKKQQESFRLQQQALNQGHGLQHNNGLGDPTNQGAQQQQGLSSSLPNQQQVRSEQHGQQQLPVSHAPDPAKVQLNPGGQQSISPSTSGQGQMSQPPSSQAQVSTAGIAPSQGSQSSLNINTSAPPSQQHHSPQTTQPQTAASQGPHPLSHKAAVAQAAVVQAARSHSQPNVSQSTPQSSTHAHPNMGNRDQQNTNAKMPIPKNLNVPPPQPVVMGPARPTLSGGPSTGAMGPMGQPAIQKHPGYVLEGEGERVLSKKKLEELVRQVTGGGDSEGGETLDPDVEEVRISSCTLHQSKIITKSKQQTLLDVADEFVDNVIIAACRLAKLRQSATLELRDIQLILERNYNIRVPGYASDELRTVKKIQPSQAWTQKLSAVQAAKVTGGKADI